MSFNAHPTIEPAGYFDPPEFFDFECAAWGCDAGVREDGALCRAHEQQAMDEAEEWRGEGCCE